MVGTQLKGGHYFFSATKEGDTALFATDDEKECRAWVAALYKATGQSHKPTPQTSTNRNNTNKPTSNNVCTKNTTSAVKR